jgi:hypothetical protein
MKKTTLKGIVVLMILALTVQTYSYAQNTARDGQTYRIRNMGTGNYLAYDDVLGKLAPAAFNAADETQVFRFMTNTTVIPGETYYTIDMGGPDASRGVLRMAGSGANNEVFSTTKNWDDTSGMSDKVQNVTELGGEVILIQAKTADSYLYERTQAEFDDGATGGFWYQGPALADPADLRQQWLLEDGTISLSADKFDTSSIFISNPVNNVLSIKGLSPNVKQVSVYSLLGKEVLTRNVETQSAINVDMSALSSGMYLVKMQGDNGSFSKKIVKQ